MSDDRDSQRDQDSKHQGPPAPESVRALDAFVSGVKTALRDNATAYGFSISITAAYGLVTGSEGTASAIETISFAFGAALSFVAVGVLFMARSSPEGLRESGQVETFSGAIDFLAVAVAVAVAYSVSLLSGYAAWPLTAFLTVTTYLLVSGFDILLARTLARRTSFGRSQ